MVTAVRTALALLALSLAACNPGFAPQYRVTDLRILAVRPTVPSTAFADADPGTGGYPGDVLRLDALVANPLGRAPLAATWYGCVPIAGVVPPCADPAYLSDPARLASPEAAAAGAFPLAAFGTPSADGTSIDVPLSGPATPPALAQAMDAAYVAMVGQATAEPQFRCRVYVELPVAVVVTAGDRTVTAFRTVRLSPTARLAAEHPEWTPTPTVPGYVRNAFPGIVGVVVDPADAATCTGGTALAAGAPLAAGHHVLCPVAPPDASQDFWQCGGDGVNTLVREDLRWQWYVTDGSLSGANAVGNVVDDAPGLDRPPGAFTLWLVVRDGRGGESWRSWEVAAAP